MYEQSAERTSEVPKHVPRKENAVHVKFGERPLPVARLDLHFPITLPKAVDSLRTNVTDRGDVLFPKLDGAERLSGLTGQHDDHAVRLHYLGHECALPFRCELAMNGIRHNLLTARREDSIAKKCQERPPILASHRSHRKILRSTGDGAR